MSEHRWLAGTADVSWAKCNRRSQTRISTSANSISVFGTVEIDDFDRVLDKWQSDQISITQESCPNVKKNTLLGIAVKGIVIRYVNACCLECEIDIATKGSRDVRSRPLRVINVATYLRLNGKLG